MGLLANLLKEYVSSVSSDQLVRDWEELSVYTYGPDIDEILGTDLILSPNKITDSNSDLKFSTKEHAVSQTFTASELWKVA